MFGIWQIPSFAFWNFLGLFLGNISDPHLAEPVNMKPADKEEIQLVIACKY